METLRSWHTDKLGSGVGVYVKSIFAATSGTKNGRVMGYRCKEVLNLHVCSLEL